MRPDPADRSRTVRLVRTSPCSGHGADARAGMNGQPAPLVSAPFTFTDVESSSDWDVACREGRYQSERTSCGLGRGIEKRENAVAGVVGPEAAERLVLDWSAPIRHQTFYKAVFRPSVLRAISSPLRVHTPSALAVTS